MDDPVVLVEDNKTYERCFLEKWFASGKRTSPWYSQGKRTDPRTTKRLDSREFIANTALNDEIKQWKTAQLLKFSTIQKQDAYAHKVARYKRNFPKSNPFIAACQTGRVKDVRYFVENFGDDITQKHSCRRDVVNQIGYGVRGLFQYNGLIVASIYEQLEVMKYLLDNQKDLVDIKIVDPVSGGNALHYAANYSKNSFIAVKLLLDFFGEVSNVEDFCFLFA